MRAHFGDRRDAGRQLATTLHRNGDDPSVIMLGVPRGGVPRGGVPVAFEVAQARHAPNGVCLIRQITAPEHPQFADAVGAGVFMHATMPLDGVGSRDPTVAPMTDSEVASLLDAGSGAAYRPEPTALHAVGQEITKRRILEAGVRALADFRRPQRMWRNAAVWDFVGWRKGVSDLHAAPASAVGVFGLEQNARCTPCSGSSAVKPAAVPSPEWDSQPTAAVRSQRQAWATRGDT